MKAIKWLYPGMRLKRWFFLLALAMVVLVVGAVGVVGRNVSGIRWHTSFTQQAAEHIRKLTFIDFVLTFIGVLGVVFAVRRALFAVLTVLIPAREKEFMSIVYNRMRLKRGPRVVAVGGGTGLPNLLEGLKEYTSNLTAVVTVADDGGSSGRLRKNFGVLPPGDIRNCLVALAEEEGLLKDLFQYRFKKPQALRGHSFGNLFLTVMDDLTGDFGRALEESSKVLAVRGKVAPVSFDPMILQAKMKDGRLIRGESRIPEARGVIERVSLLHREKIRPNRAALQAILEADAVILGPGSLYTSILPNLLVPQIAEHIALSRAVKIYVCNVMTQPGETDGYSVADHVETLIRHVGAPLVHYVLANHERVPPPLLKRYLENGQEPVLVDASRVRKLGCELVSANLLHREDFVRHHPKKLGKALMRLLVI